MLLAFSLIAAALFAVPAIVLGQIITNLLRERGQPMPRLSYSIADPTTDRVEPISVNYHFTRKCNMTCGFCFHTATSSHIMSIPEAKQGIKRLKKAGMRKINFAGGEPFLYPKFLGTMIDYCKEIGVESVSIVSNGSKVTESFLERHGKHIDILAISCDSFDEETNIKIGRGTGSNVTQLYRVRDWCAAHGIKFKLNTVINNLNWNEDMNQHISELSPSRWKCFQVLIVQGENDSAERLRDGNKFLVTKEQFEHFIERHKGQPSIVPEPNDLMATTYLILDEHMRFMDRTGKAPSKSILEVSVHEALSSVYWNVEGFVERGGVYEWTSHNESSAGSMTMAGSELEW